MKRLLLLLALLIPSLIAADDLTLRWVTATETTDGTTIPPTGPIAIDFTSVFYGICNGAGGIVPPRTEAVAPAPEEEKVITINVAGQYCFAAAHTNNSGQISDSSNMVERVVAGDAPPGDAEAVTPPLEPAAAIFGPVAGSAPLFYDDQGVLSQSDIRWQLHVVLNSYPVTGAVGGLASRDESGMFEAGHLTMWVLDDGRVLIRAQEIEGTLWPGQTESQVNIVSTSAIPLGVETVVTVSVGPLSGLQLFIGATLEASDPHFVPMDSNTLPLLLGASCTNCPDLQKDPIDGTVMLYVFSSEEGAEGPTEPTPPLPPGELEVVPGNLTAFTVVKQVNKFLLLAVGTVPEGTSCDPDQYVNGHNVVPVDELIQTGDINVVVIVAKCQGVL